jgi:hypothetical protein
MWAHTAGDGDGDGDGDGGTRHTRAQAWDARHSGSRSPAPSSWRCCTFCRGPSSPGAFPRAEIPGRVTICTAMPGQGARQVAGPRSTHYHNLTLSFFTTACSVRANCNHDTFYATFTCVLMAPICSLQCRGSALEQQAWVT